MAPKGVTADEKRKRMLDIFHETSDVFQLKDIERIATKSKGIVAQAVKDVLQSLVDDDLVTCAKIGSSNFYWSYPSHNTAILRRKKNDLENEMKALEKKEIELGSFINNARVGREDSDERQKLLEEISQVEAKNLSIKNEIAKYKDYDPAIIKATELAIKACRNSVERWTENINLVQSYCDKNFGILRSDFNKQFGIGDDFEDF